MSGLKVTPLHPTFGAELSGVDFTKPVSPELYAEIRKVVDKVRNTRPFVDRGRRWSVAVPGWLGQYGAVVVRDTKLTDEAHVEFSRYFGELDDVTPYMDAGRKHRLPMKELFDAGNIDPYVHRYNWLSLSFARQALIQYP
jgi:alpha-ketoglutarate-dependent 2,4-dichlorophenoxyacetate dioxygenase